MKIISLTAENIKKLIAVEIKPTGNLVQITGKNGQGKTCVLDSIWWALAGAGKIQKVPIRKGQDVAIIKLNLGEIIVTRAFKADKNGDATTSIKVENQAGAVFPSPQSLLDELLGSLSFDPLAFARMKPKDQFNELKKFVPGVDFEGIERVNKEDYEERTSLNRELKAVLANIKQIEIPENTPPERIDESALLEELANASQKNSDIEIRKRRREDVRDEINRNKEKAQVLLDQVNEWEIKLNAALDLPKPTDTLKLRNEIEQAKITNEIIDRINAKKTKESISKKLKTQIEVLTDAIYSREKNKRNEISKAKLPVEEISFGDNEILFNDIPFDQASDSEQLKISLAIAMASNPKLKVIRVRDGSLLDDDSLQMISEMANQNDYQVWIERVDGTGKVGFVLEDGKIKEEETIEEQSNSD